MLPQGDHSSTPVRIRCNYQVVWAAHLDVFFDLRHQRGGDHRHFQHLPAHSPHRDGVIEVVYDILLDHRNVLGCLTMHTRGCAALAAVATDALCGW